MDKLIDEAAMLKAFQDAMESVHGYRPQVTATGVLVNSRNADRFEGYQLALTTAQQQEQVVGEAGTMPGTNGGFTTAVFKAAVVPVGTKLYTAPPRAPVGVEGLPPDVQEIVRQDEAGWALAKLAESHGARRDEDDNGTWWVLDIGHFKALAQQPAAVDDAMRLLREYRKAPKFSNDHDAIKRTVALEDEIDAFLATQHQEPTT